jgi:probable HAF family extracellular repeat protein
MRISVLAMVGRAALVAVVSMLSTAVAADAAGAAGPAHPTVAWEVVDLGFAPEGVFSTATAINDRGVVVGYSHTPEDVVVGHLWRRGQVVDLGPIVPSDVNNRGVVAGTAREGGAAIWRDGQMQVLTGIPGHFSRAEGINDRGQVVGQHPDVHGNLLGYVWHRGQAQDLPLVGPTDVSSAAVDIDEDGTVVGYSCADGGEGCRPARWRDGVGEYLPLPSGALAGGAAAVDGERVVGSAFFRGESDRNQAMLWDADGLRTLDVPGAGSAVATGVAGRFVSGWAQSPDGAHAFAVVWRDGVAHILPMRQETDGALAEDVDARGRVVGMIEAAAQGTVDPEARAVLWRPVRSS